jgi:hypothetical protein
MPARAFLNRTHSITADVEIPRRRRARKLWFLLEAWMADYSFYMKDNKLQYVHNYVARDYLQVASTVPVQPGITNCASNSK